MAVGVFNPNPPLAVLDQGGVGNWHVLSWISWEVREPSYAVGRYSWGDSRTHTVEIFGEGFVFGGASAGSPLIGPSAGPIQSGTITAYRESWDGVPLWTFTGLSLTFSEVRQYGMSPDPYYGLEHYVLRGADTVTGTNGDNSISGREGDDELHGLAGADRVRGNEGADRLFGDAGNDELDGGIGDDTLNGGAGNDRLDGWLGHDTAETSAFRRQVAVELTGGGSGTMTGPEGTDTFSAVEALRFADGTLHLDPAGAAGQVWRLYGAALGRPAETTGLSAWVEALDAGTASLLDAASGFLRSAEFAFRYGNLNEAEFVTGLYSNVLGRAPDAAGLEHWASKLAGGMSRAEILIGFSESGEYRDATRPATMGKLWTADPEAMDVLRCYMTVLDRAPDASGLAFWIAARDKGLTDAEMANGFVASAEFQSRFGGLSNQDFVDLMYRTALDRPADAEGLAAWTLALNAHTVRRGDVVHGFAYSDEMTQKLLPLVSDGIAFT